MHWKRDWKQRVWATYNNWKFHSRDRFCGITYNRAMWARLCLMYYVCSLCVCLWIENNLTGFLGEFCIDRCGWSGMEWWMIESERMREYAKAIILIAIPPSARCIDPILECSGHICVDVYTNTSNHSLHLYFTRTARFSLIIFVLSNGGSQCFYHLRFFSPQHDDFIPRKTIELMLEILWNFLCIKKKHENR